MLIWGLRGSSLRPMLGFWIEEMVLEDRKVTRVEEDVAGWMTNAKYDFGHEARRDDARGDDVTEV